MMTNTLVVYTLGNITVTTGHTAEPLALCPQEQALLAYLAYEQSVLSRDFLCDLFWPHYPVENARRNLRKLLLLARRHLGAYLITERAQIRLNPAYTYWVDALEFHQQILKAGTGVSTPNAWSAPAAKALHQAVQLYRGDFLATLKQPESETYNAWLQQQQELLQQQAQQTFAHYAAYLTAQGAYPQALEVWQDWLRMAPYDEMAHSRVLTLWASTGQVHKALRHYEHYARKLTKEVAEQPGHELTALYEQLRVGFLPENMLAGKPEEDLGGSSPAPIFLAQCCAPPVPMTPLIGATEPLAKIEQALRSPASRLVTLVGPGGIGKTHMALTVAQQVQSAYAHGVAFIPLASTEAGAPLNADSTLAAQIAQALQLPCPPDRPQQVLHCLRNRELLLLLDGFEHKIADAPFIQELLSQAPQVALLVTSRERLHLAGEVVVEIPPLAITTPREGAGALDESASPPTSALAEPAAAVQLFVTRAQTYDGSFCLTCDNLPHVQQICRLVGGLPLAIEMAAAWVGHLQCAEIATALRQNLALLTHDKRGIPAQHRSIATLFEATWGQLSSLQQASLLQLACFVGPFSRQVVQQVTPITLPVIKALTDKSLLHLRKGEQYELHPLFRRWLYQQQQERCATDAHLRAQLWKSYCHYFLTLVAKQSPLPGLDPDNIRQAWQQALVLQQYPLLRESLAGLMSFYRHLGLLGEASLCCEVIMQQAEQALANTLAPQQPSELTCLLAHCRDILRLIHREIDESVQAHCPSPTWEPSLLRPQEHKPVRHGVVDPTLAVLLTLVAGDVPAPLQPGQPLIPLPAYEPVAGIAHSRH